MSQEKRSSPEPSLESALDGLVHSFERQLKDDETPAIEDFLKVAPTASRDALFRKLLKIEVRVRSEAGETVAAETWKSRFPAYAPEIDRALGIERSVAEHETANLAAESLERTADLSAPAVSGEAATQALPASPKRPHEHVRRSGQEAGERFGDYELLGEIARGGMGVVYKARQAKLNRIVAIKMILSGQLASDQDVQRFYSEAEAAARLDHPGIVPIYEIGERDGRHFFSMGFVDGASLHDEAAKGPLPQRRSAELVRQVAEAVEYAHRHGIVHRDLKPRNILMGSDGRPRVTDFGLAKQADSGMELTVSGQVLGTPAYMPPEQAGGHLSQIGPQSDVYSLGAVLYCLLVGRPPFQSATLTETLTQVLESPPVPPRLLNPAVDRDLETICLKCLEKNPSHRYGSAQELAEELQRYLSGDPIRARRLGPVTRTFRWIRRRPLAAGLIGSLSTLLIVLAVSGSAGAQFVARLRTSELERQVEERIAAAESTPAFLQGIESLLSELRPRNAAAAEAFQSRAEQAFADAVRRDLRRPTLGADGIADAERSIALLRPLDGELADALASELDRRRSDWQPILELTPPFGNVAEAFPPEVRATAGTSASDDQILRAERPDSKELIRALTKIPSDGAVRLRATFDRSWRDAKSVGALLEADAETGYEFSLEGLPLAAGSEPAETRDASLAERLERDGAIVAVIRRNGDPLVRRTIDAEELVEEALTLTVSFERGTLRLQANALRPLSFVDPFPLRTRGVFGLLWPAHVGLLNLQASRRATPEATSPLEQGDASFERGEYASALQQYELQELQADDETIRQECRFKKAMSLFELARYEEAAASFQEVLNEPGDRWPPLAGARLWALQLRQHRREEADGTFDLLTSKYDFSQFAPLIPTQVRDEISAAYQTDLYAISNAIKFEPQRLAEVQRAAAVDRYFSEDGRGDPMVQIDVARACSLLGDLTSAVKAAEPVARDTRHSTVFRHYVRFLRLSGDAEGARMQLEEFLLRNPEAGKNDSLLAIEKARIYAALGDWTRCEAEVDEIYRRKRTGESVSPILLSYAALIKGELHERRGAPGPARAVREEAYAEALPVVVAQATSMTDVLNVMILGSLSESMDDAAVQRLFALLLRDGGDNAIVRQAQTMVDPAALAKALREMWRSTLGRRYAEAFAFETIPLRDRVKVPLSLAATEYVDQACLRGEMTLAQEEVSFATICEAIDAILYDGTIQLGQIVQLALTWKGQSGFIGWGAVGPTLKPQLRAGFAYTFAHRYIATGRKDEAVAFLQTAERDAPEGSPLRRLAPLDRAALEKNEGFLAIRSNAKKPVKLSITAAGSPSGPIEALAEDGAELPVPAGDVTISLVDAPKDVTLSSANVRVAPAGRAAVEILTIWASASDGTALRGVVPYPSVSAVGARWQVVLRDPVQRPLDVAWSGDGMRFAVASEDGYVRIYPAEGTEPSAMLLAPRGLKHLCWAPSKDRILAAGHDLPLCGWDAASGARLFCDTQKYGHSAVSWRADAEQFASSSTYGGRHLRLWSSDGGLLLAPPHVQEGSEFVSLSPDGAKAVLRVWRGGYADLHVHDLLPASSTAASNVASPGFASRTLTEPRESAYQSGAFSPDGRFFVAGSRSSELSLWKTDDWSRRRFSQENHWVEEISWSADSNRIHVLLQNAPAMVLDATTDPPTVVQRIQTPGLSKGAVSPDGATIAFADGDARLLRVRVAGGSSESFGTGVRSLIAVAASQGPERRIAAAGTQSQLRLFDDEGKQLSMVPIPGAITIHALAWSPDGATLAAVGGDGHIRFWSRDGEFVGAFDVGARLDPPTLGWNQDGAAAYVVAGNGSMRQVDPQAGLLATENVDDASPRNTEGVFLFTDSREGVRASAPFDGPVALRRGPDLKSATIELPENAKVRRMALNRDGTSLAMIDNYGRAFIAEIIDNPVVRTPFVNANVASIAWSPDGSHLAVSLFDGRLQVWRPVGPELLCEVVSPGEVEASDVAWIDDGRLAIAGPDSVLRLARFADGQLVWGAATIVLSEGGWARFSPAGEPLDAEGDVENALSYVVETPAATLELLRPSEFRERVARRFESAATGAETSSPTSPVLPTMPSATEEILEIAPAETTALGIIEDERIGECSGLARCSTRADAFWLHNDSGDPELFLVNMEGKTVSRLPVPGASCFDWEDCTALEWNQKPCLLVGDVGDNFQRRDERELFLFEEPDAAQLANDESQGKLIAKWTVRFEDGPHDCEAIAFDSDRSVLLLLTKELERECGLYEAKLDPDPRGPVTARRIAAREIPAVTGMDFSPDGRRLAILTSSNVWEFDQPAEGDWSTLFSSVPRVYALPAVGQFEAIAYAADGGSIVVAGEGVGQKLLSIVPQVP